MNGQSFSSPSALSPHLNIADIGRLMLWAEVLPYLLAVITIKSIKVMGIAPSPPVALPNLSVTLSSAKDYMNISFTHRLPSCVQIYIDKEFKVGVASRTILTVPQLPVHAPRTTFLTALPRRFAARRINEPQQSALVLPISTTGTRKRKSLVKDQVKPLIRSASFGPDTAACNSTPSSISGGSTIPHS